MGCSCTSCIGRRNRRKGKRKQLAARHGLGISSRHVLGGQEESWAGQWRIEVKAGDQTRPCVSRFRAAWDQSEAAREPDDERPIVVVLMGDGDSDGVVMVRLSDWATVTGVGEGPARLPEPPPYEPDDDLITDLERGLHD